VDVVVKPVQPLHDDTICYLEMEVSEHGQVGGLFVFDMAVWLTALKVVLPGLSGLQEEGLKGLTDPP